MGRGQRVCPAAPVSALLAPCMPCAAPTSLVWDRRGRLPTSQRLCGREHGGHRCAAASPSGSLRIAEHQFASF